MPGSFIEQIIEEGSPADFEDWLGPVPREVPQAGSLPADQKDGLLDVHVISPEKSSKTGIAMGRPAIDWRCRSMKFDDSAESVEPDIGPKMDFYSPSVDILNGIDRLRVLVAERRDDRTALAPVWNGMELATA
jgi:hypothetical protein